VQRKAHYTIAAQWVRQRLRLWTPGGALVDLNISSFEKWPDGIETVRQGEIRRQDFQPGERPNWL